MNEVIEDFITSVFAPEYVDNIRKAFSLFEAFEHQNAYDKMMDAITDESVSDVATRSDRFTVALADELDFVLKEHHVFLDTDSTISDRLIIADALFRVQHLEDYTAIDAIISSEEDAIDKMSLILEELTGQDQGYFLTLLARVDEVVIKALRENVVDPTIANTNKEEPLPQELVLRMKIFFEALGQTNIGFDLINGGMRAGYPYKLYAPYVEDHLVVENDVKQTVLNILSVLYISDTPETEMLTKYREIGELVFKSPDLVGKIESQFLELHAKVEDTRKILYEKARVSQARAASGVG